MTETSLPKERSSPPTQTLILGRYEMGKLLGHGTFAKVYLARNVKTNDSVAIKAIDKEKVLKGGLISHIKREISILRRVRHPNIVRLFEVMATKSKIYFVMEYVRGGELFSKVAKGRLKEDAARKYFQQLISAVTFCHARGVYHRDIKPIESSGPVAEKPIMKTISSQVSKPIIKPASSATAATTFKLQRSCKADAECTTKPAHAYLTFNRFSCLTQSPIIC